MTLMEYFTKIQAVGASKGQGKVVLSIVVDFGL